MAYAELKKNGTEIIERDLRDSGNIYYGTSTYYLLGDSWYEHRHVDNTFSYHGKENVTEYLGTKLDLIKKLEYSLFIEKEGRMFPDECLICKLEAALEKLA